MNIYDYRNIVPIPHISCIRDIYNGIGKAGEYRNIERSTIFLNGILDKEITIPQLQFQKYLDSRSIRITMVKRKIKVIGYNRTRSVQISSIIKAYISTRYNTTSNVDDGYIV